MEDNYLGNNYFYYKQFSGDKVDRVPFLDIPHIDKVIHMGMYFILSFSFLFEINNNSFYQTLRLKLLIVVLVLSISYGFTLEILQSFLFTERSGDFYDFLANSHMKLRELKQQLIIHFIKPKD